MILGELSSFEFDCGLSVLDIFDPEISSPLGGGGVVVVVVVVVVVMFSPVNINLVVSKSTVIGLIMSSFTKSKLGIASDFRLCLSMFSPNPISSISKVSSYRTMDRFFCNFDFLLFVVSERLGSKSMN